MFTDTHAHLDYPDYANDLDEVIRRASEAGVAKVITIGIGRDSIPRSLALCDKHPNVYAAVGVHPTALDDLRLDEWETLAQAACHPKVVAIGETGLDYHRLPAQGADALKKKQHDYFLRQLELAKSLKKPVVVHCRDAYPDTLNVLRAFGRFRDEPGVMHCFASDAATAKEVFALGYVISTGGVLTFKNAPALREVVAQTPHDKLLLETDCPYLAPVPHRGKRNEPGYTRLVAEKLAEVWNIPLEDVSRVTEQNVKRVFGI
jgi:TatD DNase family protein